MKKMKRFFLDKIKEKNQEKSLKIFEKIMGKNRKKK